MGTFKIEISERLKSRRFNEIDLRVKYDSEAKAIIIKGKDRSITYSEVKTKEDVIECFADYINDYLTNP